MIEMQSKKSRLSIDGRHQGSLKTKKFFFTLFKLKKKIQRKNKVKIFRSFFETALLPSLRKTPKKKNTRGKKLL